MFKYSKLFKEKAKTMSLGVYQICRSKTYKGGEEINGRILLQGSYTCNSIPFEYLRTFGGRLG